jgi:hypothetical protein
MTYKLSLHSSHYPIIFIKVQHYGRSCAFLINNGNTYYLLLTADAFKYDKEILRIVPQWADSHTNIYKFGALSKGS